MIIMTTKEFTKKLEKEIKELGNDTDEILRMIRHYRDNFEEQIINTHNDSKILTIKYEKNKWAKLDGKTIGLDENDEDDYYTIHQLVLEVGHNVEIFEGNEVVRLDKLNKTRDEKITVICNILDYYEYL